MKDKNKLAVIGVGELPRGWFPETNCVGQAVEVIRETILDAGIDKDEIGVVIVSPPMLAETDEYHLTFGRLREELGLTGLRCNFQLQGGGASAAVALKAARGMINTNVTEMVLIVISQHYSGVPDEDWPRLYAFYSGQYEEWEKPYGMTYDSLAALVAQRYMYETRLAPEQLASVAVTLRKWAQLNPNARLREPLTIEDVLNSAMVSTPLHALERCNVFSDSALALIVTTAEVAKARAKKPVYVLGEGHGGATHLSIMQKPDKDFTRFGFDRAAQMALEEAGVRLEDVDVVELGGSYPILDLIQFEELGFCNRGEGGQLFREGHCAPGGRLPVGTNGEIQPAYSGLGGMSAFVEGVRQIREEAGERQVKDAKLAMVTNIAGQAMDSHVIILGKQLT